MNPIMFQVGNFEVRWYSFLILIGVLLAYELAEFEARKYKAPKDFMFNLTFWCVIFGLIGARVYYVIFNWQLYSHDPLSIFKFWEGGLAIHGGLIAGVLTMYLFCRKYKVRLLKILDIAGPSVLIAQAIGRWGNFFNSEAHGAATTLGALKDKVLLPDFVINGMNIDGTYYVPTFYYESLWCILGFIICLLIRKNKKIKTGTITGFYLMWYGFGRFFIESARVDSLMFMGLKVAQIVSVILFVIGLIIIMLNSRKSAFDDLYHESNLDYITF